MKRIASKIAVVVAATLISALPALAAEGMMGADQQQGQRDECLLLAKNCVNSSDPIQSDSIQRRIERISNEISKGTAVYSNEELGRLKSQLRDANELMERLNSEGA
jgi:hypothetical protein